MKSPEAFGWANRSKGTRQALCRACFSDYNRQRYLARIEKVRADSRAYHWANRDKILEYNHSRYWRDVEASRARARISASIQNAKPERKAAKSAWAKADRAANPEKWRERGRREYRQNPLGRKETQWKRRAQKLATACIPVTVALLRAKWAYWDGCCWICGGTACEWDHVKPLSKGGSHCLANLRPACRSCNSTKNNKWPLPRKEKLVG